MNKCSSSNVNSMFVLSYLVFIDVLVAQNVIYTLFMEYFISEMFQNVLRTFKSNIL